MSTLVEEMYNEYVKKVEDEELKKNIETALESIKESMLRKESDCLLPMDWSSYEWYCRSETVDYLRENGFNVEIEFSEGMFQHQYARVSWLTQ